MFLDEITWHHKAIWLSTKDEKKIRELEMKLRRWLSKQMTIVDFESREISRKFEFDFDLIIINRSGMKKRETS